ncbi:MAG: tRNA uridine-5-carboxymethylaminomethyl(34) synthesis GTPase MnmE [candidate division Zixibacteria bacterium]|nr:tRNA uridine-5-carboxymethylaminomethyl(34) synthesis GTPase MnmE [candidate division Zixibacteria bacterium]
MTANLPNVDLNQTVCAIATPRGRGGLGVVRLSGPRAIAIADRIFRGQTKLSDAAGYTVHHGLVVDTDSNVEIDEVIATVFRSPKSFSGEDLVEFSAHGGPVILDRILHIMTANGANLAGPGEFTLRAFLNGRIDLTEAEAVADLISAKTDESAAAALKQLQGLLLEEVNEMRSRLLHVLARLEIDVDFTEENIEESEMSDLGTQLDELSNRIGQLLGGYQRGRILRDGFTVVLAGPPNAGKSTLFNRLARDERAIVTEIPGTTRDILREYINLNGWPVCIVDTAGMRETIDIVERIGVERTTAAVGAADGVIWLIDPSADWTKQLPVNEIMEADIPTIVCLNKSDLVPDADSLIRQIQTDIQAHKTNGEIRFIAMSAKTGEELESLLGVVSEWIARLGIDSHEAEIAINERHRAALVSAQSSLASARSTLNSGGESELVAFDVQAAATSLGEIIGETTTDQVLGEIFGNFCIGK